MLLVAPPVLGFLIGLLAGGDAGNWARVRVRWPWFIIAAVLVRIVTDFTPLSSVGAVRYVYVLFLLALHAPAGAYLIFSRVGAPSRVSLS